MLLFSATALDSQEIHIPVLVILTAKDRCLFGHFYPFLSSAKFFSVQFIPAALVTTSFTTEMVLSVSTRNFSNITK